MPAPRSCLAVLAALVLACGGRVADASPPAPAAGAPGAPGVDLHYSRALAAPATLRLSGSTGAIEATAAAGDVVEVVATFSGRNPARRRVVVREEVSGIAVCVLDASEPAEDCSVATVRHPSHDGRGEEPDVRLVAKVPRGVAVVAETLNGSVSATGLTAEVRASTLNGDVQVSTAGTATASTNNGAIDVSFGTPPSGPLAFETKNGRVRVTFPASTNADIEAQTTNGQLRATFPMSVHTLPMGIGPKEGHARLGNGGPRVTAETLNGDVELRTGG